MEPENVILFGNMILDDVVHYDEFILVDVECNMTDILSKKRRDTKSDTNRR